MPRGQNPNSRKQLTDHAAAKKKSKKPVRVISVGLTEEAIAVLDKTASARGISRSELVERYARPGNHDEIEALKEAVLLHLVATKGCAPDRLNPELIMDSLNRLQEAFERSQSKG